jgi:hypothetical protein
MTHWMLPDDDMDAFAGRQQQELSGAMVGCECSSCRELRLRDDERMTYTARDLGRAYALGWVDGRMRQQGIRDDLRNL